MEEKGRKRMRHGKKMNMKNDPGTDSGSERNWTDVNRANRERKNWNQDKQMMLSNNGMAGNGRQVGGNAATNTQCGRKTRGDEKNGEMITQRMWSRNQSCSLNESQSQSQSRSWICTRTGN